MSDTSECLLCCDAITLYALGRCNHSPICYLCSLKSRSLLKNFLCPICKETLEQVIITRNLSTFEALSSKSLINFGKWGFLVEEEAILEELDGVNKFQCWMKGCKEGVFNTMPFLKKHLKEKHQRFLW